MSGHAVLLAAAMHAIPRTPTRAGACACGCVAYMCVTMEDTVTARLVRMRRGLHCCGTDTVLS
jgi:hypothetical protein